MIRARRALAVALALLMPALLLIGCPSAKPPDGNGTTTFTLSVQAPENQPPDLAALTGQTVLIGDDHDVDLTVQDETPETLAFAVTTSDPSIGSPNDIRVLGSGGSRTLRITPTPCHAGTAYVFQCCDGHWRETAELVSPDAPALDDFGRALDVSLGYAIVAAPSDDVGATDDGSAHVYRAR